MLISVAGGRSDRFESVGERAGAGLAGISIDKSVVFTYDELAKATDDFSIANKIGQGGFGAVYYAELRGEVGSVSFLLAWILFNFSLRLLYNRTKVSAVTVKNKNKKNLTKIMILP